MAEKLFKDRNLGIEANLGRPRTVLAIGAHLAESAQAAKERALSSLARVAMALKRTWMSQPSRRVRAST